MAVYKPGAARFLCSVGAGSPGLLFVLPVGAQRLLPLTIRLLLCAQPPSCLGQRLPGRVSSPSYLLLRFRRVFCPRPLAAEGEVSPARAPFLPPPARGLAALPPGCVPAAPGGRRPGGSAASEDLLLPGTRTRSFPAGAPVPLPLRAAAAAMDEKYLPELMAEKDSLDPSFTHALRLVNQGEGRRGTARRGGAARLVPRWRRAGVSGGCRGCSGGGSPFLIAPLGGVCCVQAPGEVLGEGFTLALHGLVGFLCVQAVGVCRLPAPSPSAAGQHRPGSRAR